MCFCKGNLCSRCSSQLGSLNSFVWNVRVQHELAAVIDCVIILSKKKKIIRVSLSHNNGKNQKIGCYSFLCPTPCNYIIMRRVCWKCQDGDLSSVDILKDIRGTGVAQSINPFQGRLWSDGFTLYSTVTAVNSHPPSFQLTNERTILAVKISELPLDSTVLSFSREITVPDGKGQASNVGRERLILIYLKKKKNLSQWSQRTRTDNKHCSTFFSPVCIVT